MYSYFYPNGEHVYAILYCMRWFLFANINSQ